MQYIIGFFMAWGNFLSLPCPYKKWDGKLKNIMLAFLPGIGLVIGFLWLVLYFFLQLWNVPEKLGALAMMIYIYGICGFMHLDGFMDCNDAIMSRRPLEERQKILKDSHTGAFAAITLVLLFMSFYICMESAYSTLSVLNLLTMPVISRGMAALFVLSYKPIGHSQYVSDYEQENKGKYKAMVIIQMFIILVIALSIARNSSFDILRLITSISVMALTAFLVCLYGRNQLGGMSGDIAGYTICCTELVGMIILALV